MRDWAAPLCDTIQQAHRGRFDADALRAVYATDAVFDDPCGTIRTPKGIVRGFELIHWLCDVDVEPTDDEWSLHPPAAGGLVFSEDAVPTLPAQARLEQRATYTSARCLFSDSRCLRRLSSTSTSRREGSRATRTAGTGAP